MRGLAYQESLSREWPEIEGTNKRISISISISEGLGMSCILIETRPWLIILAHGMPAFVLGNMMNSHCLQYSDCLANHPPGCIL